MSVVHCWVLVTALGPCALAHSQSPAHAPDTQRGTVVAAQGTAGGIPACASCHGQNGASDGSGAFPRIAGQTASYLSAQLRDFASGLRSSDVMSPIAKMMSPDDIADTSAYYASVQAPFPPPRPADSGLIERGAALATTGNAEKRIQSCNNCHGPGGIGEPPAIPYLAGQYGEYITAALQTWKDDRRRNSSDSMGVIAKQLDPAEITAVAAYYRQVQPK